MKNTYTEKPKAYINAVLLDDQFKPVNTNDGKNTWFEQVGDDGELKIHLLDGREITKNGYLYIYTSNETENIDVFFDNLQVTHIRGPLLEETHYYPFGLTMAGISSKSLKSNYAENRKKFQGQEFARKEFSDGSGLEMYEFKYRFDDPQTGRFWQIDPLADKYVYNSTYAFSENHVTTHVELEGLEKKYINDPNYITYGPLNNVTVIEKKQLEVSHTKDNKTSVEKKEGPKKADGKPLLGKTVTNKVTEQTDLLNTGLGDKITVLASKGQVSGQEGIVTIDVSTSNDKVEGVSATFLGVTTGISSNGTISLGVTIGGKETHVGIGPGVGLGEQSFGASYTDTNRRSQVQT